MGDVSIEPSMEDILSSIKRIIAEDGDGAQLSRPRRAPRTATTASIPRDQDTAVEPEVLELNDLAYDDELPEPRPSTQPATPTDPTPLDPSPAPVEAIVSQDALASSRGSLSALTRMVARPEVEAAPPSGDGKTVDAFVADLLRPMLREWLDTHLPELVEAMVAKEIARITASR